MLERRCIFMQISSENLCLAGGVALNVVATADAEGRALQTALCSTAAETRWTVVPPPLRMCGLSKSGTRKLRSDMRTRPRNLFK